MTQTEMLRLLIRKTACEMDAMPHKEVEKRISHKVSMCNYWANRLCCQAADQAIQVRLDSILPSVFEACLVLHLHFDFFEFPQVLAPTPTQRSTATSATADTSPSSTSTGTTDATASPRALKKCRCGKSPFPFLTSRSWRSHLRSFEMKPTPGVVSTAAI